MKESGSGPAMEGKDKCAHCATLSLVVMRKNPYEVGHPKQAQFDKNVVSMIVNNSLPITIASS